MPQAMRKVGTDSRHYASTKAAPGQAWYTLAPPVRVQHHHGRRPDQPMHRERQLASQLERANFFGLAKGDDLASALRHGTTVIDLDCHNWI
jgi:hypothetical protein